MDNELTQNRQNALSSLWHESKEREAQRKALKLNLDYIDLDKTPIESDALETIPFEIATKLNLIPFQRLAKELALAIFDPETQEVLKIIADLKNQGYQIKIFIASQQSLEKAWDKYKNIKIRPESLSSKINVSQTDSVNFQFLEEKIKNTSSDNVTLIVSLILKSAILTDASDIHIEPQENQCLIRFRIDGVLYDILHFDLKIYKSIRDRLKLHAGLKLNILNQPQDGRFEISNNSEDFEVRVSSIPGAYGEFLVFRLLNPDKMSYDLEELGFKDQDIKMINNQTASPNGLILNTGPTGSGKTTTLYALLKRKVSPGIKIITIENPIFASGLKSIMRQDPDVILVGEIRDKETAEIAIQASLTGHLVFSTLHTNEASDTINRLIELGIDRKLLPSSLKLIMAQRLVRKLCPHCKEQYEPDGETKEKILKAFSIISPKADLEAPQEIKYLYRAKGCDKCMSLGYKGQIAIYEGLIPTENINQLVLKGDPVNVIREKAIDEGMIPLFHDGLLKAISGITSLEEVYRVAGDMEYITKLYEKLISKTLSRVLKINQTDEENVKKFLEQLEKRTEILKNADLLLKIKLIISGGLLSRATDIHIEPQQNIVLIRYRIDNVLHNIAEINANEYLPLINQIKELSGADTQITKSVQEGRFYISQNGEKDVRVSIIPGGYGESAVLRILQKDIGIIKLEELGLLPQTLKTIEKTLKPTGILLVCGPTGSGKTTTLFGILNKLNQPGVKIITVEDPIEYRLPGALQTQVDEAHGYTFESALRILLRQNPNIILIGEIRDEATAKMATQAALTGHLILSTIHTNDALSSIARLKSFKLDDANISVGLNGLVSQRIIRKLCPKCKKSISLNEEQIQMIQKEKNNTPEEYKTLLETENKQIYESVGCAECQFTGYFGMMAIFEAILVDEEIKSYISQGLSYEILTEKLKNRYLNISASGLIRLLDGTTSWQELQRVLGY
ncbi:MAG: GspE/PulE family protein [Candidatus Parcubacteria bacterium]|nr:GspE/PulE family protein [Candidatus Parcubacteria bacterium]